LHDCLSHLQKMGNKNSKQPIVHNKNYNSASQSEVIVKTVKPGGPRPEWLTMPLALIRGYLMDCVQSGYHWSLELKGSDVDELKSILESLTQRENTTMWITVSENAEYLKSVSVGAFVGLVGGGLLCAGLTVAKATGFLVLAGFTWPVAGALLLGSVLVGVLIGGIHEACLSKRFVQVTAEYTNNTVQLNAQVLDSEPA